MPAPARTQKIFRRFGKPAAFLLLLLVVLPACRGQSGEQGSMAVVIPTLARPLPTPLITATLSASRPAPTATPATAPTLTPAPTQTPTSVPNDTPTATATPGCQETGQIVTGRFSSAVAGPDRAYRIYLPPCYGQDGRVYPVLYMLQGNIWDDRVWDYLGIDEAAEAGIQSGQLPPMLIVMPASGQIANTTSGGPWSFEGVIVNELLPYIEANYCGWPAATGRAIGGLSRGGYWSLEIAFRNPNVFGSVGGHAAALVDSYAGPDMDPKYTALSADLSTLRIYLDIGQNDWFLGPLRELHDNLLAAGKEHEWIVQEGSHVDAYWMAHTTDYLTWYAAPWPADRAALPLCETAAGP